MGEFEGGYFVEFGGNAGLKEINCGFVEGRAEELDTQFAGVLSEWSVPLVGGAGLLVEVVQLAAVPEPALDYELGSVGVECDAVSGVGLELDGIDSCFGSQFDYAFGCIEILVMVAG